MQIKIDLSGFDGPWSEKMDHAARLGHVLAVEASTKFERGVTNQVPVDRGYLKSTVKVFDKGNEIWIGPYAEYAPYPVYYGPSTNSSKQSTTYLERGRDEGMGDMEQALDARANEFMESGV